MIELKQIIEELIKKLNECNYVGDFSDLGNEIGIVIGKYIQKDNLGFSKDDFEAGLSHGISISNGSH